MQMKIVMSLLVCGAISFTLIGCGNKAKAKSKGGEIQSTIDTPEAETDRYIEFDGIGAADQTLTNTSQRKSLSEAAGRNVAIEKLTAYLKGMKVDATTTVEQAITTDQRIQTVVDTTIRGIATVKREWLNDDGCIVTIRLDKKKFIDQVKEVRGIK